ncbi:MAG TPA: MotA/TolQ/ExbB proton channel family protein, partial [Prosthecobacter sp.]|nr:MotA/TolQ/ExbB proton channel family protein [Prosthecobacter sp.]
MKLDSIIPQLGLRSLLLALALSAAPAFAQDPAPPAPEVVDTTSLLDLYHQGGWTMHILLVFSVGTVAVAAYCFLNVSGKKMAPKSMVDALTHSMQKKDVGAAYQYCLANPCSITRVLSSALLKVNFDRDQANKVSMEEAAGEALDAEETRYTMWVNYLNVFATISPMIGLFGT